MKRFLTKKYIISAVVLVLVVVGFVVTRGGQKLETATVARATVVQEVVVTGKTKAQNEVELGFDTSGRVARSLVGVGDRVAAGQLIAELDISADLAALAKERALLAENETNRGTEGEKIESAIREAYSAADNAVRNKADQFFKTSRTNPVFEVKFSDGNYIHYFNIPAELAVELNNLRREAEVVLNKFQVVLVNLNAQNSADTANIAVGYMNSISSFLNRVAYAVNSFTPAEFTYESTVTGYKTAIDSARTSVATAREGILNANNATSARVDQTGFSITALEANLRKSRIVAPFTGTVTRQDAKIGQIATAGTALVSIISESDLYIEANVSEINIGKVAVGNTVEIEFDAYPGEKFPGTITFIDPGETVVDEVVNYKIRIELAQSDERIKSGLTAAATIASARKDDVLAIPIYAVSRENGRLYANKIVDEKGTTERVELTVGIIGSDGMVEILSGLLESDTITINGTE